ncbi:MAG: amidohydrolase family protein [Chitinophagales bacterium]|nr:amidohydrolase family protein [Chitinophagales bacterium]
MRKLVFCIGLLSLVFRLSSQETTFKTNGPDDYREGKHAFTNATIFVSYNQKIDSATLYIQDGKVVKIERGSSPSGGKGMGWIIHDMSGKFIYPSFIDIFSDYGMPETKKESRDWNPQPESNIKGAYGWNQAIHTDFQAHTNFTVNDKAAEELRKLGFGTVLTHKKDGIARGTGAVVTLANDKENLTVITPYASAHYSFNKGSSTQDYPSSLMGSIALLRQTYYDAKWYSAVSPLSAGEGSGVRREFNINLEEWNKQQTLPQIFDAGGDWQKILRADKVGDEFGVQYIIKASGDEYQRVDEVKNTKAKLITTLNFPKAYDVEDPYKAIWVSLSEMKHWELAPTNPAALAAEQIDFAFTLSDLEKKEEFLPALRKAVKYGLDSSLALKALTYNPASFVNVYDKVGSLEAGKLANFFITSKPLFDEKCEINENWIQGKRYEVKAFEPKDVRGEYSLQISEPKKESKNFVLKVTGEVASPKGLIVLNDTTKLDVKLTNKDNDITLSFALDKKPNTGKFLLTGTIEHAKNQWSGKGQNPEGEWLQWSAAKTKPAEADTAKPKKDTTDYTKNLGKVLYPFQAYGNEQIPMQQNYLLKNATVWTNEAEGNLSNTDVIIRNGKISSVGKNLSCSDCQTIDATGKHIASGIIDEHSHVAISQGVNEGTEASSAEVRIGDVVNSQDVNVYRQLAGGVVAAQLLHGSANPIGGQSALVKFRWGYTPEKMKIEGADGFIKFALGENVKQSNWGDRNTTRYPQTRMGVEQTYYNYFTKAKEYEAAWKTYNASLTSKKKSADVVAVPRRDIELDALAEILNKKRFITCHSYVQSEINMLMHVADSFGFKVNTFTHILEGYKVADKMKAHGVNASTFADWWAYKYEVIDAIPYNTAILTKAGITTAVNSDDAEMARRLNHEAAKSVKYGGLSEIEAWKTVTLNPAKMLHLDNRTGSIKAGKDADIVVWSDNPLSVYAKAEKTFVDGILFFDRDRDEKMRQWIRSERARLIQKMLEEKKGGAPTQEPKQQKMEMYSCGHEH